ncbi:MAG: hypothetical protein KGJ23_08490 [Euryarchaeota archaeon]|nr:hypothetical protein [Euryarchaeota archaeon]MDE1879165.1 hypothetical protein [Euryarchaeota archaeon]MDE2044610.1 hypothetical protein [Thermoplasmata archaeon]
MPGSIWLDEFGCILNDAFGTIPYLVGSALEKKEGWRDVDVRVLLSKEEWDRWQFGDPERVRSNSRWVAVVLAFSALGQRMTSLPIDFQPQLAEWANAKFPRPRSALGIAYLSRFREVEPEVAARP